MLIQNYVAKLRLVKGLVEDGKPYKKILREKYGYIA